MLFSREFIALLALASTAVVTAAPTPQPLASDEVNPTPALGEIFEYGNEYKRDVDPTPELGEIFEYGNEYKHKRAAEETTVDPTPALGEIFEYGNEYKREVSK
ncbi:hypothetical protein OIDMADRAFT_20160 [Oidiodendron maius Zn]|uniref:Uncharacterized protein n=1 Tax=Oidiodendron maius (strain Zn) TaxID=913774 RepID=A0A0C3D9Z6_OIDMZ|nr:hypothetical protein OIDMADRAFT_20160 [Oidiodendron maius Zn]